MVKAPISKTGDIRYFEIIKIFVLVSFLCALYSKVSLSNFENLYQMSFGAMGIIILLTSANVLLLSMIGLKEIKQIIDRFIIRFLVQYTPAIKEKIIEIYFAIFSERSNKSIQYKLCVLRC